MIDGTASAQKATITIGKTIGAPGDTAVISIHLSTVQSVSGISLSLLYSSDVLKFLSVIRPQEMPMTVYATEGIGEMHFVFLDSDRARVLESGVHELAQLSFVIDEGAPMGRQELSLLKYDVADGQSPPRHVLGTSENGEIWITKNVVEVTRGAWVSHDDLEVVLSATFDRPIAGLQFELEWQNPMLVFGNASIDNDWRLFSHVTADRATRIVVADFSGTTPSGESDKHMISVYFHDESSLQSADRVVIRLRDVLATDKTGQQVPVLGKGGELDFGIRPVDVGDVDENIATEDTVRSVLADSVESVVKDTMTVGVIDSIEIVTDDNLVIADSVEIVIDDPVIPVVTDTIEATVIDTVRPGITDAIAMGGEGQREIQDDRPDDKVAPLPVTDQSSDLDEEVGNQIPKSIDGLRFDEILADPPPGASGDANGDGHRNSRHDEFVEILNAGAQAIDLSGYLLSDDDVSTDKMFQFPKNTVIQPGERIVLFGGGDPIGIAGQVFVDDGSIGNGLTNSGDRVVLIDSVSGDTLLSAAYESPNNIDQSLVAKGGGWVLHSSGEGKGLYSPGMARTVMDVLFPMPAVLELEPGEHRSVMTMIQYTDGEHEPLNGDVLWVSLDTGVVQIGADNRLIAQRIGETEAWFFWDGRESLHASVRVVEGVEILSEIAPSARLDGLVISEIYPNPASGQDGDTNGDGVRHSYEDEFVELANTSTQTIDLSGYLLSDDDASVKRMFRFPEGATIYPGSTVTLFGGGLPKGNTGAVYVDDGRIGDGLSNAGDGVVLMAPDGTTEIASMHYETSTKGVSWARDESGNYLLHNQIYPGIKKSVGALSPPGVAEEEHEIVLPEGLVFSEVFISPGGIDANKDGEIDALADQFVELVNTGKDTVDLSGWLLGDDDTKVSRFFRFPDGTMLPPNAYLTVFGGGRPVDVPGSVFVAGGKIGNGLSKEGEVVHLFFPDGKRVAMSVILPKAKTGFSWVLQDGGEYTLHQQIPGRQAISPGAEQVVIERLEVHVDEIFLEPGMRSIISVFGILSDGTSISLNEDVVWHVQVPGILWFENDQVVAERVGETILYAGWLNIRSNSIWLVVRQKAPIDTILATRSDSVVVVKDDDSALRVSEPDTTVFLENAPDTLRIPSNTDPTSVAENLDSNDDLTLDPSEVKPNRPPQFMAFPDSTSMVGFLFKFRPRAIDADRDSIVIAIREHPSWLYWDGEVLQGVPAESDTGSAGVVVWATDGRASISLTAPIRVISVMNQLGAMMSVPVTGALTWRQHLDLPPGVQVQVDGGPEWHAEERNLVWKPDDAGQYSVVVALSTGAGEQIMMPITLNVAPRPMFELYAVLVEPKKDTNGDGRVDRFEDQYIAIRNVGKTTVDVSGWLLGDDDRSLVKLPEGVVIGPGEDLFMVGMIDESLDQRIFSAGGRIGNGLARSDRILLIAPDGPDTLINTTYKGSSPDPMILHGALEPHSVAVELAPEQLAAAHEDTIFGTGYPHKGIFPTPNPFNSATRIGFYTTGGPVFITVYSVLGQPIRRLVQQQLPAGYHQRIWDGTNDNGVPVSSGVYLVHMEGQRAAFTRRVALVR